MPGDCSAGAFRALAAVVWYIPGRLTSPSRRHHSDHFRDRLGGADCVRVLAGVQSHTGDVLGGRAGHLVFSSLALVGFQNETRSPVRHP
jgi:hypothetical protein